jgi:hypothetical protein
VRPSRVRPLRLPVPQYPHHATFPHPRLSNRTGGVTASGSRKRHTMFRVTPSATSGTQPGVARHIVNPHVLCCLLRPSLTEALPSAGVTRLRRYYGPLRHPTRPGLALASCQLIPTAITAGASRVASDPLCLHAVATTPAGSMELIRSYRSTDVGLPEITDGSAPALSVSRPAQRSRGLQPADSPGRLMRPLHRRLQRLRCLHRCSDCYGVERSSSRAGLSSRCGSAPFTAHCNCLFYKRGCQEHFSPSTGGAGSSRHPALLQLEDASLVSCLQLILVVPSQL